MPCHSLSPHCQLLPCSPSTGSECQGRVRGNYTLGHPADCVNSSGATLDSAFNSITRESMFVEVREHIPGLAAWLESFYSSQPLLHLGSDTILSCCGVQQGDPLGPLGFAITLQPIVERIKAEVPGLILNSWYLDDGTLMGSAEDLAKALNIIESDGPAVGLVLNRSKSLPQDDVASASPLPPDIPVTCQGFTLLGCPIGPPSFCEESLLHNVEKIKIALIDWETWGIHNWRQLCSARVSPSLSSPSLSGHVLPVTFATVLKPSTRLYASVWSTSSVDPSHSGPGSKLLYPAG